MHVCGYPTFPAKKYLPQTFFCENLQKNLEDLYLSAKKSESSVIIVIKMV